MASISSDVWKKFFASCKVPTEVQGAYAKSFVQQRIAPDLLRELGKEDLRELGIKTLGDQLAIIRYVKQTDGSPPEFAPAAAASNRRVKLTKAYSSGEEDEPMAVDQAPALSKAPDRHDIYHVKMPEGNLPRTRNILEMNNTLRDRGILKRGVSGVRRSGVELHGVSTQSKSILKRTSMMKPVIVQDMDVSSTVVTGGRVPSTGTMRSDSISTKTIVVKDAASPQKRMANTRIGTIGGGGGYERVQHRGGGGGPFKVQLGSTGNRRLLVIPSAQQQRPVVNYGDVEDLMALAEEEEDQIEQISAVGGGGRRQRRPISERIQLIGPPNSAAGRPFRVVREGAGGGGAGGQRRSRPVVTVGGRQINLGGAAYRGPKARGVESVPSAAGVSILDRITLTK